MSPKTDLQGPILCAASGTHRVLLRALQRAGARLSPARLGVGGAPALGVWRLRARRPG